MSTKQSAEFKAKIALEAIAVPSGELDNFAQSKGVTKEEVMEWVKALKESSSEIFSSSDSGHASHHHAVGEHVELKTEDEELAAAVGHGVHNDDLDYKRLFFWTVTGTALVIVIVVWLIQFSQDAYFDAQLEASVNSEFSSVKELKAKDAETLNSFGVVDAENGIYRIPIDEAINKIAEN